MQAPAPYFLRVMATVVIALVAACGGSDDNSSSGGISISGGAPTAAPAAPSTSVPSVNPTPTLEQGILTAAYGALNAQPLASCPRSGAPVQCAGMVSQPVSDIFGTKGQQVYVKPPLDLARGIALLNVSNNAGENSFAVMGRNATAQWQLLQVYKVNGMYPIQLPADGYMCSPAGGITYPVRAQANPTAPTVTSLKGGDKVRVEEFVLTRTGTATAAGDGFFRISAPAAGWVEMGYLADAIWVDCGQAWGASMLQNAPPSRCPQGCTTQDAACPWKGKISPTGEKLLYAPPGYRGGEAALDSAKGDRWFCSPEEAYRLGWKPAP